jgi:starch phosphorylase
MANLAIVGSHSTNGVAAIHSELLRTTTVKDLAEVFPERFSNKTNGVTPRRWLRLANPALTHTITDAIGDGWVTDLGELRKLAPLGPQLRRLPKAKRRRGTVRRLASLDERPFGRRTASSVPGEADSRKTLLNALLIVLYDRLREHPPPDGPRTFFFAGKATPYRLASDHQLVNNLAGTIDGDPAVRGRLVVNTHAT